MSWNRQGAGLRITEKRNKWSKWRAYQRWKTHGNGLHICHIRQGLSCL